MVMALRMVPPVMSAPAKRCPRGEQRHLVLREVAAGPSAVAVDALILHAQGQFAPRQPVDEDPALELVILEALIVEVFLLVANEHAEIDRRSEMAREVGAENRELAVEL